MVAVSHTEEKRQLTASIFKSHADMQEELQTVMRCIKADCRNLAETQSVGKATLQMAIRTAAEMLACIPGYKVEVLDAEATVWPEADEARVSQVQKVAGLVSQLYGYLAISAMARGIAANYDEAVKQGLVDDTDATDDQSSEVE